MNDLAKSIEKLTNIQKITNIAIIKQILKILISETNLEFNINSIASYENYLNKIINIAATRTKSLERLAIERTRNLILKHTIRGYLFPQSFEALTLEIIQILEYICISLPISV